MFVVRNRLAGLTIQVPSSEESPPKDPVYGVKLTDEISKALRTEHDNLTKWRKLTSNPESRFQTSSTNKSEGCDAHSFFDKGDINYTKKPKDLDQVNIGAGVQQSPPASQPEQRHHMFLCYFTQVEAMKKFIEHAVEEKSCTHYILDDPVGGVRHYSLKVFSLRLTNSLH